MRQKTKIIQCYLRKYDKNYYEYSSQSKMIHIIHDNNKNREQQMNQALDGEVRQASSEIIIHPA